MTFSRGKVQILYNYLPGAVFSHDTYGFCRVTGLEFQEEQDVNREAVAEVLMDTLRNWHHDWQVDAYPEIRDAGSIQKHFVIGRPTNVRFEPYPKTFQCQRCRRVYSLDELKRSHQRAGSCPEQDCGGYLAQFSFVQAHNCGRLEQAYINRKGCLVHGTKGLYFDDTGRVFTARWRCRLCGGAEIAHPRQNPCECSFSEHAEEDKERRMRFFAVTDPAVYRPWVTPFVNFEQQRLAELYRPEARPLILARTWSLLDRPVSEVLKDLKSSTSSNGDIAGEDEAIRELAKLQPDHPLVEKWRAKQANAREREGDAEQIRRLAGASSNEALQISRRMVEHVALLDSLETTTVPVAAKRLRHRGDDAGAQRIEKAAEYAGSKLGIRDLRAVEDFPIGICAVGYTRVTKAPEQSVINPFPRVEGGRTPLYAVVTTTEALYFQLDPVMVCDWLNRNRITKTVVPADEQGTWAWLYRAIPGLRQRPGESAYAKPEASAVRTLLHSLSHIFLRHIEWSGYAPQSLGEYLLPEGLACVLYANRYTDTKVGGLLTLFEQRLQEWLEAAYQGGVDCVFDPFCSDGGAACVGCLHREYNCPTFNGELSRSTLYGGPVAGEGLGALPFGPISVGYWG